MPPRSFVCSYMHGNKRIRYQSKLIYSYEDGVPTVLWNECVHSMPLTRLTAQPVEPSHSPSLFGGAHFFFLRFFVIYFVIFLICKAAVSPKLTDDGWAALEQQLSQNLIGNSRPWAGAGEQLSAGRHVCFRHHSPVFDQISEVTCAFTTVQLLQLSAFRFLFYFHTLFSSHLSNQGHVSENNRKKQCKPAN